MEKRDVSTVRTRVAPSPTGDPHVGTAYVAWMNAAFARQHGGEFILRIEDTDRQRSTRASEDAILESLRWLGLTWTEGPDVGGSHGPYRQSERGAIYDAHVGTLLDRGSSDRLDGVRKAQQAAGRQPGYDGHCLHLPQAEVAAREAAGDPYVVRMRVPCSGDAAFDDRLKSFLVEHDLNDGRIDLETGVCRFTDMKRGEIVIPFTNVDMQVLTKSDGMPTYHLANVVDDHLMRITHVLRGEEWISSAPKHVLLYAYFGWQMPALCHLPLLRNPDKSKLSKRKNPTSILHYRRMGYLPEALLNLLGLFSMNVGEGDDTFSRDDLQAGFSVDNIALGGPVFDVTKLDSLNARHIRALAPEDLAQRLVAWAGAERLAKAVELSHTRIERLSDVVPLAGFLFAGRLGVSVADLTSPKMDAAAAKDFITAVAERLETVTPWTAEAIGAAIKEVATARGLKPKDAFRPLYVAVSGKDRSLPLFDSIEILGKDMLRVRLRDALAVL